MDVFFYILQHNIIPILLLILAGFTLSRKFDIHLPTMSKLNFYLFVPAFIFVYLYTAPVNTGMVKILILSLLMLFTNHAIALAIARLKKLPAAMTNAFKNVVMFNNCGNIGVSLIALVYTSRPYIVDGAAPYLETALAAMVIILITQSLSMNTIGFFNAGQASLGPKKAAKKILLMPIIYVIPTAALLKVFDIDIKPTVFWPALNYLKAGLVPIALLTLGVQLAQTKLSFSNPMVYTAVLTRLIIGPILAMMAIYFLGLDGILAQVAFIAYAAPTAVNVALISIEYNNHPEFSAQTVMVSTLLSTVTLTLAIYIARVIYPLTAASS